MTPSEWRNPWQWSEFRRVRRALVLASSLTTIAILGLVPSAWIIVMPEDPMLRPDLTTNVAWVGGVVLAVMAYSGQTIARRARSRFDHAIYEITRMTREHAELQGIPLEIDCGETYPPILLTRETRWLAVAGPDPLLIDMDRLMAVEIGDYESSGGRGFREPHLVLRLREMEPENIYVVPGRGLGRANLEQVRTLQERINGFLRPRSEWNGVADKGPDVAAFVESMRNR